MNNQESTNFSASLEIQAKLNILSHLMDTDISKDDLFYLIEDIKKEFEKIN